MKLKYCFVQNLGNFCEILGISGQNLWEPYGSLTLLWL